MFENEKKINTLFTKGISYVLWKTVVNIFSLLAIVQISLDLFEQKSIHFKNKHTEFLLVRLITIIVLFVDIFIKFNVQSKIDKRKLINKKYEFSKPFLLFIFAFDFLPAFLILFSTFFYLPHYIDIFVFLKVISLVDADSYTQQQLIHHSKFYFTYKILRLMVILLFIFNFFGCIFYLVGLIGLNQNEPSWLDFANSYSGIIVEDQTKNTKYIISTYWAVETLTSIGYGDITPINSAEIFITDFALFGQMFLIVYTVSFILQLQDQANPYDANLHAIKKFMKLKQISNDVQNQVIVFLEQYFLDFRKRDQESAQNVLTKIPKVLQQKVLFQAYQTQLLKIEWLFNRFSVQCISEIGSKIKELHFGAQEYIEQPIDDPRLFIVVTGQVSQSLNGVLIKSIGQGGCFGNYEFVTGFELKTKVAKTESYVTLYSIKRSDLIQCLQNSFEDYQKFQEIQDQVIYEQKLETIGLFCLLCKSTQHLTQECQQINIREMIKDFEVNQNQKRRYFQRTSRRHDTQNSPKDFLQYKFQISDEQTNLNIDKKCKPYPKIHIEPFALTITQTKINPIKILRDVIEEASCEKKNFFFFGTIPTISCSGYTILVWEFIIFINVLLLFNLVPLIIFFYRDYDNFKLNPFFRGMRYYFMVLYVFIQIILTFDIIIKFNLDFYYFGALIKSRKQICLNYLKTFFFYDLIPVLILMYYDFVSTYTIIYLFILIKAVPFFKIEKEIQERLKIYSQKYKLYLIIKMFLEVLYLQHFWACMFFAGGEYIYYNYPGDKTWLNDPKSHFGSIITEDYRKKFVLSYYWAVNVITTVGYGDIYPLNNLEWFINDLALISAIMIAAININNIALIRVSSSKSSYIKKKIAVNTFMKQKCISKDVRNRVLSYMHYSEMFLHYRNVDLEQQTFQLLPRILKNQLMEQAYSKIFKQSFLSLFDNDIIQEIVHRSKEIFFSANENIFFDNEYDEDCSLYFIENGSIQLFLNIPLSNKKELYIAKLKKNECFGHFSFLTGMKRQASARSKKHVLLVYLERENFLKAIKKNYKQLQLFESLKYEVLFKQKYHLLNIRCYTCSADDHMCINCPLTQIKEQVKQSFQPNRCLHFDQERIIFKRSQRKRNKRLNYELDKQFVYNSLKKVFTEQTQQINFVIDENNLL